MMDNLLLHNYVSQACSLADQLITLADTGDDERTDITGGVFFAAIRDCGYKIKAEARKIVPEGKHA